MSETKFNAFERLYKKLDTKEGDIYIYILVQTREKKSGDLRNIRYINSDDNRVILRDDEVEKKWRNYHHKLYKENLIRGVRLDVTSLSGVILYCRRIKASDIKNALRTITIVKSVGPTIHQFKFKFV